ncbi:MAG: VCBS repeat-containing protein, partial [Candidatus Latescibacterota bacterium]
THTGFNGAFKKAFDRLDNSFNNGLGYTENVQAYFWMESKVLMSYVAMYHATGDADYLKRLARHARIIISKRDDFLGRQDYAGQLRAAWASQAEGYNTLTQPYAFVVHSGLITYPLADFVQLVRNDSNLRGEMTYSGESFGSFADWLGARVSETIAAHEDQYDMVENVYKIRSDVEDFGLKPDGMPASAIVPYNQQSAMGRTLLMMYKATGHPDYLYKVIELARFFKDGLQLVGDTYVWEWGGDFTGIEDISHGALSVDFAHLCWQNGIVFNDLDMLRFAATFLENIYLEPLSFSERVSSLIGEVNKYIYHTPRWLHLSDFNPDIYHIVEDFYFERALVPNWPGQDAAYFLGYANLARYQRTFEPIAITRSPGSGSNFVAAASGDFDGDGIDEVITIRNSDGNIYIYKNNNGCLTSIASLSGPPVAPNWAGVAAADFDADGVDECVVVKNSNGSFVILKLDNSTIKSEYSSLEYGAATDWRGVATGDFDADGTPEFASLRNSDGQICLFEVAGEEITLVYSTDIFDATAQWAAISAGDFDGDGSDELVAARNSDGAIFVLRLENGRIGEWVRDETPGSGSEWLGIAAGDFDGDGKDEYIANRNVDGDFYQYSVSAGVVEFESHEYFVTGLENDVIAAGRLSSKGQAYDELVVIRNYDGDIFVFSLRDIDGDR